MTLAIRIIRYHDDGTATRRDVEMHGRDSPIPKDWSSTMPSLAIQNSMTHRPGWRNRFGRKTACCVGIDLGIDSVRIAALGVMPNATSSKTLAPTLQWLSQSRISLPIDSQTTPPSDWVDVVSTQLLDRLPRCIPGDRNVAMISLPLPWIHYQTSPEMELTATLQQCDEMFEASIFKSPAHVVRWPLVPGSDQNVIAATARSASLRIAEVVASIGYEVCGILPQGVALLRAAPKLTSLSPAVVLLLELSGGLIALGSGQEVGLCRHLPACDNLANETPDLDVIEPWLQEIASEVTATSRYVRRLGDESDPQSPVLISGRAAQIKGVDAELAKLLGRPVATWRYAGRSRPQHQRPMFDADSADSSMAVSLSLAYCCTEGSSGQ